MGIAPLLDHFVGNSAPTHVIAWISEEDIEYLIKNAADGTRFIFKLFAQNSEEAKQWLERMRNLSPRKD